MTEAIIDFSVGEAIATYHILAEFSKHREPPLTVFGSHLQDRPTINVTLTASMNAGDALQEYKTGRAVTIQNRSDHETEHFRFVWIAPN